MCQVQCEILGVKDQEGKVPAQMELTDGPLEEPSRKSNCAHAAQWGTEDEATTSPHGDKGSEKLS